MIWLALIALLVAAIVFGWLANREWNRLAGKEPWKWEKLP